MASPQPRIGVVVYPGSNDDRDALWALAALDAEAVPVWHEERDLPDLDAVVLPGGFSYGDYLRCGAIARFSPATAAVCELAESGGLVLGICNGSVDDIAAVCNENGNVMGLMPHPEHAVDSLLGSSDGALILASLVEAARERALAVL